jgi:hypothetical protein
MQSPSTSVASTGVLPSNPPAQRVRREIWPVAVITLGAVLTVAWVPAWVWTDSASVACDLGVVSAAAM